MLVDFFEQHLIIYLILIRYKELVGLQQLKVVLLIPDDRLLNLTELKNRIYQEK